MGQDTKVAVVTGASRGAGRGIAEALGAAGYTVYVTGRTELPGQAPLPGTIHETASSVTAAGGRGIPVRVDHGDDSSIAALFARVCDESGHIDVLVNNAAIIGDSLIEPGPFWEKPLELADILDVGLRCHYVASWHAAKMMAPRGRGLITFTSSFGSVCYMHGPAYGAQKAGVDKFAADMAIDFQGTGVAAVSIWMGPLLTERFARALAERPDQYEGFAAVAETPHFTGRLIAALAADPDLQTLNGQTLIGAELATRYGLMDAGNKQPPSYREMLGAPRVPHPAIVR
jgi:NAD(P)-dependent dehydrogenase (short-subunit alcohol dehydrogenase family)